MTISEISIIFILAVSFVANVCYVLFNRRLLKLTHRWDIFRWISTYRLFYETPRHFELFYRDRFENNEISEWREIRLSVPRRWFHPIFYPEKLVVDTIYSFVDDLVKFQEFKMKPEEIYASFNFETVIRFIWRLPSDGNPVARQFRIVEAWGHFSEKKEGQTRFVSQFHKKCIFQ